MLVGEDTPLLPTGPIGLQFFPQHPPLLPVEWSSPSDFDAIRDPAKVRFLEDLAAKYKKRKQPNLQDLYSVFQLWYGTINQFRPTAAKWVYCTLGAKKGILDFSAGWGGRALAAMSLGIPYTGFDANKNLAPCLREADRLCRSHGAYSL
jgi:hypothetical protein